MCNQSISNKQTCNKVEWAAPGFWVDSLEVSVDLAELADMGDAVLDDEIFSNKKNSFFFTDLVYCFFCQNLDTILLLFEYLL